MTKSRNVSASPPGAENSDSDSNSFLTNTARELFLAASEDEILSYAVEKLFQIIRGKGIITYANLDVDSRFWEISAHKMAPSVFTRLSGLLGYSVNGLSGWIEDDLMQKIPDGRLEKFEFEPSLLTGGKVPDKLGNVIKKAFSIEELFCISVKYDEQVFGNFTIITTEKNLPVNVSLIESFISQVNIFVQKIRVEKALVVSEDYFRTLFQQAAVGLAIVETRTGRFKSINQKYLQILGYPREELLPENFMNTTHPDDLGADLGQLKKLIRAEVDSFTTEKRLIKKSGEIVWIKLSVSPLWKEGEPPLYHISVVEDITERKKAVAQLQQRNEELFQSSERYKALIISSNTGAWEYAHENDDFWCSPEYYSMLGYDQKEFRSPADNKLSSNWTAFLHPDDSELALTRFQDYLSHPEGMYENYYRMRHANGEWIWIVSRGRIIEDEEGRWTGLTVGTHINITQLKKIENELLAHKTNLETLIKERTAELEQTNSKLLQKNEELLRFNELFVNREFRIKELKEELRVLKKVSLKELPNEN